MDVTVPVYSVRFGANIDPLFLERKIKTTLFEDISSFFENASMKKPIFTTISDFSATIDGIPQAKVIRGVIADFYTIFNSLNTESLSAVMTTIGLVIILLYSLRRIFSINLEVAANSVRTFSLFVGFLIAGIYAFS